MTATWLRVETDRPSRLQAPSHAPPPQVEGMDRLFEAPLALRRVAMSTTEDIHLFQFPNEDRMGTVRVTCGGRSLDTWDAQTISTFAVNALRLSSTKGAGLLLDSCTTRTPVDDNEMTHHQRRYSRTVSSSSFSSQNAEKYLNDYQRWHDQSLERLPLQEQVQTNHTINRHHIGDHQQQQEPTSLLFWETRKPSIHRFASSSGTVPLHPFLCILERRRSLPVGAVFIVGQSWMIHSAATAADDVTTPLTATPSVLQRTPANIASLAPHKEHFLSVLQLNRGVFFTMARCLAEAFPRSPLFSTTKDAVETLTNASMNTSDAVPDASGSVFFFSVFNLGGLVLASRSFVEFTSQWEKVLISSLAMDQLIPKAASFDADVNKDAGSAVRIVEVPLKMCRLSGQRAVDLVVVTVGSALSMVFALLPTPASGVKGAALADALRSKVCSKTPSPVYNGFCQRNARGEGIQPTRATTDEEHVPLFPGLHGRGTGSLHKHIDVCTVEPDNVGSSKLLDELSSSDDESEDSVFCGCTVAGKGSSPAFGEASSERVLSATSQDILEALIVRSAAKFMKLEERCVAPLVVKGGCVAFHATLQSDSPLLAAAASTLVLERQRQLHQVSYHAFEVSLWRYAHSFSEHRGIASITHAAAKESQTAMESFRRCQGAGAAWEPHFSYSTVRGNHHQRIPTTLVQHAKQVLPLTETCAVLTVSTALDEKAVATHMEPSNEAHRTGFSVSTKSAPYGVAQESWRALRSFSSLSEAVMEGCLALQRTGLVVSSS
ncbi:Hypothetical protein, putative [Bodo saltans]|uniref:Uncharacterized protein n=1 Tax=Bodo saltans TaxID=75058 RepID=A0A0S4IRW5_BODSA|nr:Hypothetical protein, putative [Bodo saltans]|eukprot:CUF50862.1 Hypothetical protein, putative [Bodo saltans]